MDFSIFLSVMSFPFWLLGITLVLVALFGQVNINDEPGGATARLAVGATGLFFLCVARFMVMA